jgi:hypothetical protein
VKQQHLFYSYYHRISDLVISYYPRYFLIKTTDHHHHHHHHHHRHHIKISYAIAQDKKFTKIMLSMLKLDTNSGFHDLFLIHTPIDNVHAGKGYIF